MSKLKHYSKELKAAIQIAKKVGKQLVQKQFSNFSVQFKENHSIVSTLDLEAQKMIQSFLKKKFPSHGFLGEESQFKERSNAYWVVDPIDGTTNFVKGLPLFAVSIALVENSVPVVGVVFVPSLNECFYASKGNGAFLNDVKLDAQKFKQINQYILSLSHKSEEEFKFLAENVDVLRKKQYRSRVLGSCTIALCYVACGRMDCLITDAEDVGEWDVAAGLVILREAHCFVLNEFQEKYSFNDSYLFAFNHKKHLFILDKILKYKQK
ncbi:MAG: inositol monophosphatase [Candidatus Diapherotrites archaeon]|nr:inositol monophosphatase [Candidatus Diapherotrites archaeon]